MSQKYYEVISPHGTGVTSVISGDPDTMLHTVLEGRCTLGEITKEQFEAYGDNPWVAPISEVRFTPRVDTRVVLLREQGPQQAFRLADYRFYGPSPEDLELARIAYPVPPPLGVFSVKYMVEIMDGDGRTVGMFRADLVEEVCEYLNNR